MPQFESLWIIIGIILFIVNAILAILRGTTQRTLWESLASAHPGISKKIYALKHNWSGKNIFLSEQDQEKTLSMIKHLFSFGVLSKKKSSKYYHSLFRVDLIQKLNDRELLDKVLNTIQYYFISDFFKGIFLLYMILTVIVGIIYL